MNQRSKLLTQLRQQAEQAISKIVAQTPTENFSADNIRHILHELQVHQIELEMQNEELSKTQEQFQALTKKYRALYDLAPVGYLTMTQYGLIAEANLTLAKLLGVNKSDLIGHEFAYFIKTDINNQNTFFLHCRKVNLLNNETCELQLINQKTKRPFYVRLESIRANEAMDIRTIVIDITERKLALQALAKLNTELETRVAKRTAELKQSNQTLQEMTKALEASKASFQSVVEKNQSGIMVLDQESHVLFTNQAIQKIFCPNGLSANKQFGIPINANKRIQIRTYGPNKKLGTAEMDVVDTLWENQPAYLVMLHDITELKETQSALETERNSLEQRVKKRTEELSHANAELARAARLKDEFLANMSHELRTPLNAIQMMSEILLDKISGPLNEEQSKAIRHIEAAGSHLLSLINDILDLSKIEAGKMTLEIQAVRVKEICQASLQFVKQAALKKQIQISTLDDNNVKVIQADERNLKQILVNLLTNAIKFTPQGGKVTLEVIGDQNKNIAYFTVSDTGIGIPENEMVHLFQPFVQIDSSLSRQHEGTGLGLSLVYKLTEMHGGSVTVESQIGKGSRFTVSLPWYATDDSPPEEQSIKTKPVLIRHPSALILLAEDNETNILGVQIGLQAKGYQVIVARNGIEAIELAKEKQPALIFMDIQMPQMDGIEATRHIRADKRLSEIPIIALTALAMPNDQERCLQAGCDGYLSKPVNIKTLVKTIEAHL